MGRTSIDICREELNGKAVWYATKIPNDGKSGITINGRKVEKGKKEKKVSGDAHLRNASSNSAGSHGGASGKGEAQGSRRGGEAVQTPNSRRGPDGADRSDSSPPSESKPDPASQSGLGSPGAEDPESPPSSDDESDGYGGVALPSDFGGKGLFLLENGELGGGIGRTPRSPEVLGQRYT